MQTETGFHHVGLCVREINRTMNFLSAFGFELEAELQVDGDDFEKGIGVDGAQIKLVLLKHFESSTRLELIEFLKSKGSENSQRANDVGFAHVGLFVKDIDGAVKKGIEAGATAVSKVAYNRDAGLAWIYLIGPEGTTVELLQKINS